MDTDLVRLDCDRRVVWSLISELFEEGTSIKEKAETRLYPRFYLHDSTVSMIEML